MELGFRMIWEEVDTHTQTDRHTLSLCSYHVNLLHLSCPQPGARVSTLECPSAGIKINVEADVSACAAVSDAAFRVP